VLRRAVVLLEQSDPMLIETTLLIVTCLLRDFRDYNQFLSTVDDFGDAHGWAGRFQIASFHPKYQFAGTEAGDPQNLTNRSPYECKADVGHFFMLSLPHTKVRSAAFTWFGSRGHTAINAVRSLSICDKSSQPVPEPCSAFAARDVALSLSSLSPTGCEAAATGSIPAASTPQVLSEKKLGDFSFLVATDRQRTDCPICLSLADSGHELPAHIRYIAERWHLLQPHIREAIVTLIDAAAPDSNDHQSEGRT